MPGASTVLASGYGPAQESCWARAMRRGAPMPAPGSSGLGTAAQAGDWLLLGLRSAWPSVPMAPACMAPVSNGRGRRSSYMKEVSSMMPPALGGPLLWGVPSPRTSSTKRNASGGGG